LGHPYSSLSVIVEMQKAAHKKVSGAEIKRSWYISVMGYIKIGVYSSGAVCYNLVYTDVLL